MDVMMAIAFCGLLLLFMGVCVGRALLPISGAWIVVTAQGDGEELEQKIYALLWLQGLGVIRCPICILEDHLSDKGRRITKKVLQRWEEITFWDRWGHPCILDEEYFS